MATTPDDSRAAITGTVFPQPGPHMPPRHDGIPCAGEMEDRQIGLARDVGGIVLLDQLVAAGHDVPVRCVGAAHNEFLKLNRCAGAMMKALLRAAAVELAERAKQCHGNATADGVREADSPRPGMTHESPDEDQALDVESCRSAGLLLSMQEGPRDLGREGFAKQPAGGDVAFEKRGFDGGGIVIERPIGLARVGCLDETRAIAEGMAKGREKSPITVQAGQVNQRGFVDGTVKTELKTLTVCDGGNVMRKT